MALYALLRLWPWTLFRDPVSAVLLSREGTLLSAKIAADGQWRFPPIGRAPEKIAVALRWAEDRRFYRHPGVDPLALLRALRQNRRAGRVVSGGSTLTMQVVRLSRKNPPRTVPEKIREAVLAPFLEARLSKDGIMALYASHAPFGGNVVGVEAAAWRYFGRAPESLSWAEASLLAVLPNNPSLIHPGRGRPALLQKRNRLLDRLRAQGLLTDLEARLAMDEPLPAAPLPLPRTAAHLLETLLVEHPGKARFRSTLSAPLQKEIERLAARHMEIGSQRGIRHGAVLVIDHHRMEVAACVGNHPGRPWDQDGAAVDLVRSSRSTGSLLKPFLYAGMLQEGEILPGTLIPDRPSHYSGFVPENFDRAYRGAVPARMALARSLNVPAVHMLHRYGVTRFAHLLKNLGMSTLFRAPEDYGLTLVLGGAEGTLWDLTNMNARLAAVARGEHFAQEGYMGDAKLLSDEGPGKKLPVLIGPGAAYLTLEALREVSRPGVESFWKSFASARPVAWKTGTSYGQRDGWAIGSDGRYTVGVWVGNASGEGRPDLTGIGAAAPLLFAAFNRLEPGGWWTPPSLDLKEVVVCRDDGYLPAAGCETEAVLAPSDSSFDLVSPHHRLVHLDPSGRYQVHSRCEDVSRMRHATWFVLPPSEAQDYAKGHLDYHRLPPYRDDCRERTPEGGEQALGLLYPPEGAEVYIPRDFGGKKSRVVFRAVHQEPGALLFWHLDDEYLGSSRTLHDKAVDVGPGAHVVAVVDEQGRRSARNFRVLNGREGG